MQFQRQTISQDKLSAGPGAALFEHLRWRRARSRNLDELEALDSSRLEDIGLSEQERARIIHANRTSSSGNGETVRQELYAARGLGSFMVPSIRIAG